MKEPKEENKDDVKRHLCDNCGADMVFDPGKGTLACPYCDSSVAISSNLHDLAERDLLEFLDSDKSELQPLATDAKQISCDSCGATVTFVPPTTATSCDFCAAKLVAQPRDADPLVAPKGILPFSVENRAASSALKQWTSTRWFAPNALKRLARHDRAESIYVPFWTFDAETSTDYTGMRGEDYQETEHYTDSSGNRRTRTHTRTNWYPANGRVHTSFDDAPVPATTSVLPGYIARLKWDFGELSSYDPAYLAGHKAQTYQVSLEDGFAQFQVLAEKRIEGDVRQDIGGHRQMISTMDTTFSDVTFKHILVPVYAGAYRLNNKAYQVLVNGRTGEVLGERPYSVYKIAGLVLFILAVILLIILFSQC